MNNEDYIPTILDKVEEFFDIIDCLKSIYYENIRLKQENIKLRKESQERFEQIMDMNKKSQEGVNNWINLILDGKIKLVDKD